MPFELSDNNPIRFDIKTCLVQFILAFVFEKVNLTRIMHTDTDVI